ncbi:uncharacterized protein LOC128666408 [Bombina bombina]|uniref:uncharacterized protein LOC128666408 n=1 Tax=Bombina bombina TaxID=8345 RepID=UPI00235AFEB5|nr:uncharacterized protein LOC128666408 [Bombina bombina]
MGSGESSKQFVSYLNSNKVGLSFTSCFDINQVDYLDIILIGDVIASGVKTKLYTKPISANSLIHARSSHPHHLHYGVAKGQLIRAKRNCTEDSDYVTESTKLVQKLRERCYPEGPINRALKEVNGIPRDMLLKPKPPKQKDKSEITFVTTYTSQFNEICNIIKKNFRTLRGDDVLKNVVDRGCRFVSRRNITIGNMISPSMLKKTKRESSWLSCKGHYRCGTGSCTACKYTTVSKVFQSSQTHKVYECQKCTNCRTEYAVYLVTCQQCRLQYVGCTSREVRARIREHLNDIDKERTPTGVSKHFLSVHQGDVSALKWIVIDVIDKQPRGGNRTNELFRREAYWIFTLSTRRPVGLNIKDDVINFWE